MRNVINRAIMAKKKFIFTLMLATTAGVWTMSEAMCQVNMCTCMWNEPPVSLTGTLDLVPLPCAVTDNEEYPCLPCLTTALSVGDSMYFLTSLYGDLEAMLDTLVYPATATVTGYIFTAVEGGLALDVRTVSIDYSPLPSLCDTWNMLHEPFSCMGPYCYLETNIYTLATDTLIQDVRYVKLMEQEGTSTYYKGALREGSNRDIYYVPANSTNEYLIYAFNAQVGDELQNVWLGGEMEKEDCTNARNATVIAISNSNPRVFTLEVYPYQMNWIEGVGMSDGPVGSYDSNKLCIDPVDLGVYSLLCAYKNGELVYSSSETERYGCEFNGYDIPEQPADTIPLYIQDDPGSSTVDPVDPNQVVATLQGDQLTIHEKTGVDVTYSLQHTAPAQAPSLHKASQTDTFRNEVTVQITQSGEYLLQLTNPSWGYTIFGWFYYEPQGVGNIPSVSSPQKVLMNGQILILRGDRTYTLTGQEVK